MVDLLCHGNLALSPISNPFWVFWSSSVPCQPRIQRPQRRQVAENKDVRRDSTWKQDHTKTQCLTCSTSILLTSLAGTEPTRTSFCPETADPYHQIKAPRPYWNIWTAGLFWQPCQRTSPSLLLTTMPCTETEHTSSVFWQFPNLLTVSQVQQSLHLPEVSALLSLLCNYRVFCCLLFECLTFVI